MIILGLGTNLGNRKQNLRKAIRMLDSSSKLSVIKISHVYESQALLLPNSPPEWNQDFLNICVEIESSGSPTEALNNIKKIEKDLGRNSTERWSPRIIDIDIIIWNELSFTTTELTVPHREMHQRPFVMLPLCDLSPEHHTVDSCTWCSLPHKKRPFATCNIGGLYPDWVGILNLTPDSFSDGGNYTDPVCAVKHINHLIQQGASVIDIGAESTRPGATEVSPDEEWRRLEPVLQSLKSEVDKNISISIDTRHASTAAKAIESGINWINDVSGSSDGEMIQVLQDSDVSLVLMHSLNVPPSLDNTLDISRNPVTQILNWAEKRISELNSQGIEKERLIFDPGIGFGKTAHQNIEILRECKRFHSLGVQLLIGHSRKSFLNYFHKSSNNMRDLESALLSEAVSRLGIDYFRVHDIEINELVTSAAGILRPCTEW